MNLKHTLIYKKIFGLFFALAMISLVPANIFANTDFTVVLDPGHGGHDHGAIDNNAKEKDINLSVALKVGELLKKKMKDTKVVFTRDDDTFVSLQGRAEIANKSKADLFVSIHTNSVDAKNKNRSTVAGASVYTQGPHKDEANMGVARRENSVIELENGYEQKYCGFDPNKDESYIIFEMAQKKNLSQSNRFAKYVQDNMVNIAGRKNRGVHQAGFWVLWSTSMPSVLIELDFICNPESAKFMTSAEGINKLADAIYQAIKTYGQNLAQKKRMASSASAKGSNSNKASAKSDIKLATTDSRSEAASTGTSADEESNATTADKSGEMKNNVVALAYNPESEVKDLSHTHLDATKKQYKARHSSDGRRRRSASARSASESRDVTVASISVKKEFTGKTETRQLTASADTKKESAKSATDNDPKKGKKGKSKAKKQDSKKSKVSAENKTLASNNKKDSKATNKSDRKEWVAKINDKSKKEKGVKAAGKKNSSVATASANDIELHAGARKSLRSRSEKNLK